MARVRLDAIVFDAGTQIRAARLTFIRFRELRRPRGLRSSTRYAPVTDRQVGWSSYDSAPASAGT